VFSAVPVCNIYFFVEGFAVAGNEVFGTHARGGALRYSSMPEKLFMSMAMAMVFAK
jgi:hypothetical protein